jgi:hypothetical protein
MMAGTEATIKVAQKEREAPRPNLVALLCMEKEIVEVATNKCS